MATMIDKIRNKIRSLGAEAEKREKELDALRSELAALEERRTNAIDADDLAAVENLTRQRADLMIRIEAREEINRRKNDQGITRAETAAAWADDCKVYQKQIDKDMADLRKLMRQAAEKAADVSEQINAAWTGRVDALTLIGDQEPDTINAGNGDFAGVSFSASDLNKVKQFFTNEEWAQIRPGALESVNAAVLNRVNNHFHFN